jgi:hypothetical protein
MAMIQLSGHEGRLLYLALQYHLARPGSELDPETKQPAGRGLSEVASALEPQLEQASATFEVVAYQQQRLDSALAGTINELKAYALLDAGRRTTVPSFHEALRRLFPEVEGEPEAATQLAGELLALRRRLEGMAARPEREPEPLPKRKRWKFWR